MNWGVNVHPLWFFHAYLSFSLPFIDFLCWFSPIFSYSLQFSPFLYYLELTNFPLAYNVKYRSLVNIAGLYKVQVSREKRFSPQWFDKNLCMAGIKIKSFVRKKKTQNKKPWKKKCDPFPRDIANLRRVLYRFKQTSSEK